MKTKKKKKKETQRTTNLKDDEHVFVHGVYGRIEIVAGRGR
jgi:hypothetical protein